MTERKKEELPDYTVADMNVEGMPWNSRRPWQIFPGDPAKRKHPMTSEKMSDERNNSVLMPDQEPISSEERRGMIWIALKAALCVALVFGTAALVFIIFCVFVWLK